MGHLLCTPCHRSQVSGIVPAECDTISPWCLLLSVTVIFMFLRLHRGHMCPSLCKFQLEDMDKTAWPLYKVVILSSILAEMVHVYKQCFVRECWGAVLLWGRCVSAMFALFSPSVVHREGEEEEGRRKFMIGGGSKLLAESRFFCLQFRSSLNC